MPSKSTGATAAAAAANKSNKIMTPIRKRSMMTGWKSAFEFEQPTGKTRRKSGGVAGAGGSHMIETTSRLRRRSVLKKGTFQKKAKDHKAPDLLSVVNAKPEIKKRATEEAKDREKKREEKKKLAGRITVRKKDAPTLKKDQWTNALKPSKKPTATPTTARPKMKGKKSSITSNDTSNTTAADWKKAYQDIFSPQSGKPKVVAKQDLINENKMPSPKKKARSPPQKPSIPKLPDLPLDEADDDNCANYAAKPSSDTAAKKQTKPVLIEPDDSPMEEDKPKSKSSRNSMDIEPSPVAAVATTTTKPKDDTYEDFVDFDSQADSEETPIEEESSHRVSETASQQQPPTTTHDDTIMQMEKQSSKKQLVLEFALPSEEGEEDDGRPGLVVPVDLESMAEISSVGSWPSIESDDSYDTRMHKMMQRWVDVDGAYDDDYDETATIYDNDVDLEDNVLDHIVLAAPDLDEAMAQFEELSGIRPTPVGPLQGLGAKTAHIGLDDNRYIEILAPDEENPGPIGEDLKQLEPGTLTPFHYAIRSSEVTRLIEGYVYDVLGWDPDHIAMVQALPDNSLRQWDLLTMYGHDVGGVAPCYVKWKDHGQHPTASIALKADLLTCTVRAPAGHDVHKLITGVGGVNVEYGKPLLECVLATPKGRLTFSADFPVGLVFPGYEDEHMISEMPELLPVSGEMSGDEDWADIGTQSESSF